MKRSLFTQPKSYAWLLLVAGLCRLISLGLYPLSDKTESRYGEIARIMAETGNWVTPHVDYGVPFWGKPPLSTWLPAIAIKLFGENEFAVRFPSLLLTVGVVTLVFLLVNALKGKTSALAAAVVLSASPMFFVAGGSVMTDPALVFGTTLSMVGFYLAMVSQGRHRRVWGYLFFVGLAIGLLAKGPIAVVLTGVPIFLWMLWQRNWTQIWQKLPWLTGLVLTAVIAVPWYLLAESHTPGFIDYFIVGEHWKRFVEPGWTGDLYGGAHSRPRGTIWVFWLLTAFPWSLLVLAALVRKGSRIQIVEQFRVDTGWSRYFLLWSIAPMLFFSMAGNALWTYVLPGLPAFSILISTFWQREAIRPDRMIIRSSVIVTALFIGIVLVLAVGLVPFTKSQKQLVEAYQEHAAEGGRLVYIDSRPYSARFYSGGKALLLENVSGEEEIFLDAQIDYFAIRSKQFHRMPDALTKRLVLLAECDGRYNLYAETTAGYPE